VLFFMVNLPSVGGFSLNPLSALLTLVKVLASPTFLSFIVLIIAVYFLYRIYVKCPFQYLIFERVGNSFRYVGTDFGYVVDNDGKMSCKMLFRKKTLPYHLPQQLIAKSKLQNVVVLVKLSPDEFVPHNFGDKSLQLMPIDQDVKFFAWETHKSAVLEAQQGKSLFERHNAFFSWALWGVIGLIILVSSAKYGNNTMADANSKSVVIMRDATASAASAAGQIASALTTIQLPQPQPVPPPPPK